jgi:Acetyltransferase (GNAT) domain
MELPMSELVQCLPAGSPLWADYLRAARHDFYSSPAYHDFMQQQGQGEAWLAVAGTHDRFLAWPLLRRPLDAGIAPGQRLCDITSVYGYGGPLAHGCSPGDPFLAGAWQAMVEYWRARGVVSLFCRFHPLLENHRWVEHFAASEAGRPDPALQLTCEGHTVSLDLARTDREAWAGYRESHRRHITRARRSGLVCETDYRFTHLPDFMRLYHDTMRRNAAAAEYFFTAEYFEQLRQKLDPAIFLHVAHAGRRLAAAALVSEYQGIVQYLFGGVDGEFLELSPLKLLIEAVRHWARSRGNSVVHLGGGRGGREDSLFYFKSGFSPRRHAFYTGRCVLDPVLYRSLAEQRTSEAAGRGGTLDLHYFPAYRAPLAEPAAGQPPALLATA